MPVEKEGLLTVRALKDIPGNVSPWGCREMVDGLVKDSTYAFTVREGIDVEAVKKSVSGCGFLEVVDSPAPGQLKAAKAKA